MSEAVFIKRRERQQLEGGFDSLRREGIKLAQQLSGQQWTDYNLHDPGVTILEQLIYAITDLIYRTDFSVEDFLVNEAGEIDFEQQVLHRPEQIFSCRPTTLLDYRKAILNEFSELDNVWLIPLDAKKPQDCAAGLYRIALKFEPGLAGPEKTAVEEKVRRFYHRNRNLSEDITGISVVDGVDYELCAEIEVGSKRRPVDILAEIYFGCSRRIAGGISLYGYDQFIDEGQGLDELFSGPFTNHGVFKDEEFGGNQVEFMLSSLYSAINSLEGVDHVREVYLERDGERFYDMIESDSPETAFNLVTPGHDNQIKVVLTTNGRVLSVSVDELRAKFDELNFRYHSIRCHSQDMSQLYDLPEGIARPLSEYVSIQEQFPNNYGINTYGVPESAAPEVKARAKQLKAYLLLFEQIMANYLANLGSIRTLFSIDSQQRSSYAVMPLSEQQIAGLGAVYPDEPAKALNNIMAKFDDFNERKSRLLDYLLAMYGETFSQHSLRHFNDYYSIDEVEQVIVNNKIEFLQSIIELGRDRVGAADYNGGSWALRAGSGLQQRVSILLGFKNHTPRSLSMAILKQGLKLARHQVYEQLKADSPELEFIDTARLEQAGFETVPALPLDELSLSTEIRSQIEETIPLKNNLLSDELLRGGIYLDRYRIGSLTSEQGYQLTFQTSEKRDWYLGTYGGQEEGISAANALQRFLIGLNVESEGLHIIEHLLLRPLEKEKHVGVSLPQGEDFYSFRVSVVFPAWTSRCHNPQFRNLAEETVRINAPAHVCPEFFWLDFHKMYEFEMLYEKWMSLKSRRSPDVDELNYAAMKLIAFLLENHEHKEVGQ